MNEGIASNVMEERSELLSSSLPSLTSVPIASNHLALSELVLGQLNLWTLVFILLLFELSLLAAMILPLPFAWRRSFIDFVAIPWQQSSRLRIVSKTVFAILGILFLDSLREMYFAMRSISSATEGFLSPGPDSQAQANLDLMASQRNAFLCGTTVFLFVLLHRFQSLIDKIAELESQLRIKPLLQVQAQPKPKQWQSKITGGNKLRGDWNTLGGKRERVNVDSLLEQSNNALNRKTGQSFKEETERDHVDHMEGKAKSPSENNERITSFVDDSKVSVESHFSDGESSCSTRRRTTILPSSHSEQAE